MLKIESPVVAVTEVPVMEHDVARINSVDGLYKNERQLSKAPTFA